MSAPRPLVFEFSKKDFSVSELNEKFDLGYVVK